MSAKELSRLTVIEQVLSHQLTQVQAAKMLSLSERHISRLKQQYLRDGPNGLISKKKGKASNRRIADIIRAHALEKIKEHFYDYGPTFASAKESFRTIWCAKKFI